MLTQSQVIRIETRIGDKFEASHLLAGIIFGALVSLVPMMASFEIARHLHLTAAACPDAKTLIAVAGSFAAVASAMAVWHFRNSAEKFAAITASAFMLLGVAISMTV